MKNKSKSSKCISSTKFKSRRYNKKWYYKKWDRNCNWKALPERKAQEYVGSMLNYINLSRIAILLNFLQKIEGKEILPFFLRCQYYSETKTSKYITTTITTTTKTKQITRQLLWWTKMKKFSILAYWIQEYINKLTHYYQVCFLSVRWLIQHTKSNKCNIITSISLTVETT